MHYHAGAWDREKNMSISSSIEYWIELAEYDLETAEVMLRGKRFLYVGFMCHQVIEKILKANYVCTYEQAPPYVHNILLLSQETGIYEYYSDNYKDQIDILTPLNIEARYPKYREKLLRALNYQRCKSILYTTREMFQWIKERSLKRPRDTVS